MQGPCPPVLKKCWPDPEEKPEYSPYGPREHRGQAKSALSGRNAGDRKTSHRAEQARKALAMTEELRDRMESLRALAPRLNSVTDQAAATIKAADEFLAGLGIGIPAQSHCFKEESGIDPDDEDSAGDKIRWYLAYGRCNFSDNKFSIHVRQDTERPDDRFADVWDTTQEHSLAWSNLNRSDKLKAFAELPSLLENIAKEAVRLAESAESTTATVGEMMAALGHPVAKPGADSQGGWLPSGSSVRSDRVGS
jgi:hypothetical protein